jgi:hypothetical protein
MFLGSNARPARKADKLTANYEPILILGWCILLRKRFGLLGIEPWPSIP